jgi:hypothetical protein
MIKYIYPILVMALAAVSCDKEPAKGTGQTGDGTSSLILKIENETVPETKSSSTDSLLSGDKFENLRIWLVSSSDNSVTEYYSANYGTENGKMADTISFEDVPRTSYKLYILANSDNLNGYIKGSTITSDFADATIDYDNNGSAPMPLSYNAEITVSPGTNEISAKLLRTSARYSIVVHNHAVNNYLAITKLQISSISPDRTYIFNHDYAAPSDAVFNTVNSQSISGIAADSEYPILDKYVYEGSASSYDMTIEGAIFSSAVTSVSETPVIGSQTTTIHTDNEYFIKSHYSGRYLGISDGNLTTAYFSENELKTRTDIANYLWTFSGTSSTTLRNVGTGQYLAQNYGTLYLTSSSSDADTYTKIKKGGTIVLESEYSYWYYRYYLSVDYYGNVRLYESYYYSKQEEWILYPYSQTIKGNDGSDPLRTFSKTVSLNYIDKYGSARPLEGIHRNEHLTTTVNVFYNENTGSFEMQTENWSSVNGGASFN